MNKFLKSFCILGLVGAFQVQAQTARVQVIHNSADAAAASVDVWVNGNRAIPNFAFRTASPFVDLPAGQEIVIHITAPAAADTTAAVFSKRATLDSNQTYIVVASGIVSASGYSPATPFDLYVSAGREAAANAAEVDVLVFHGATDAPAVDVNETSVPVPGLVPNLAYGDFAGYLNLAPADYTLEIAPTGGSGIASFTAPLQSLNLAGNALVVVASGFLDPAANSNGSAFGLFAATAAGGPLVELPAAVVSVKEISNAEFRAYPNPATDELRFRYDASLAGAQLDITDATGRLIVSHKLDAFSNEMQLGIHDWQAGFYFGRIQTADRAGSFKLVVNK
ncbi:MAG: DUF4397 domain-containing protein [Bacteroidia bacterium]